MKILLCDVGSLKLSAHLQTVSTFLAILSAAGYALTTACQSSPLTRPQHICDLNDKEKTIISTIRI